MLGVKYYGVVIIKATIVLTGKKLESHRCRLKARANLE